MLVGHLLGDWHRCRVHGDIAAPAPVALVVIESLVVVILSPPSCEVLSFDELILLLDLSFFLSVLVATLLLILIREHAVITALSTAPFKLFSGLLR